MIYQNLVCTWNVIDDSHKILLGISILIFGIIGLILNLWLFITFLRSDFLITRCKLYLLAFCIGNLIRGILILPLTSFSALFTRWPFGYGMCQLTAFLKLMIGIFQITILAVIALERVLSVASHKKEKDIAFSFYLSSITISWIIAAILGSLPLAQIGSYIYDTTCTTCELDWKMEHSSQLGFNVTILILGGLIPIIMMLLLLPVAISKERRIASIKRYEQRMMTNGVTVMSILTLLFWFPQGLLIIWITFLKSRIPKALGIMAPLSAEAATIIPVLTYLVYLPTLRNALITILAKKRPRN